MNIQHSSRTDDWHTPEYIIKLINQVLIHIDLDPASDNIANQIIQKHLRKYFQQ